MAFPTVERNGVILSTNQILDSEKKKGYQRKMKPSPVVLTEGERM
jgi:hypothetical protein